MKNWKNIRNGGCIKLKRKKQKLYIMGQNLRIATGWEIQ